MPVTFICGNTTILVLPTRTWSALTYGSHDIIPTIFGHREPSGNLECEHEVVDLEGGDLMSLILQCALGCISTQRHIVDALFILVFILFYS